MSDELGDPPTREVTFYPNKKAKQIDIGPEGFNWMRRYVQRKLLASGVIPEDEANPVNPFSIAAHIVHEARRQPNVDFDGKGFPCVHYADELIDLAIRFPPDPISHNRFSLKAFIKDKQP